MDGTGVEPRRNDAGAVVGMVQSDVLRGLLRLGVARLSKNDGSHDHPRLWRNRCCHHEPERGHARSRNRRAFGCRFVIVDAPMAREHDMDLLQAALVGYESQRRDIEQRIADIRRQLGSGRASSSFPVKRDRTISPEGRARIAAAQKKRWAAAKMANKQKRTLSPEQRAKLLENLKKAREARHAK